LAGKGSESRPGSLRGVNKGIECPTRVRPDYPRRALQEDITGMVVAHLYVGRNGDVTEVKIISSTPRRVFDSAVTHAARQYKCAKNDENYILEVEFVFNLTR